MKDIQTYSNIVKKYFRNHMAKRGWHYTGNEQSEKIKNYAGARSTRLTADWPSTITSPGTLLRYSLTTLRARSRELCINNDYARAFLWLIAKHISGPEGIKLQNKAKMPRGMLDKDANDKIEESWQEFGKKGNFEVSGTLSMTDADRIVIQTVARDGEIIIRLVENFDNPWLFALQFFESDYLDENLNITRLPNGNSIRMGIEFNKWMRPVAYHLLTEHPGDYVWSYLRRQYERIPAEQILHPFIIERIAQIRGVPWMHSAMTRLNNIGAYEEAEIIGARIGASNMGIWESQEIADVEENPAQSAVDANGSPVFEVEPGIFVKAPPGYTFKEFDPKRPSGTFAPFMKATLRGISSGLLCSYNTIANDLESVNYSSLRAGSIEERDMWRLLQSWMIINYKQEVYMRWLRMALLTQQIRLPLEKINQFAKPKFMPRSWAWVDPEKDIKANILALDNLLTTRTDIAAEQGEDFEEILIKRQEEEELMKKYGIQPVKKTPEPAIKTQQIPQADPAAPAPQDIKYTSASRTGKGLQSHSKLPGNGDRADA